MVTSSKTQFDPRGRSRFATAVASAALIVIGLSIGYVLAEVGLRLAGERIELPQMVIPDDEVVFRLKPGVREHTVHAGYFDYTYSINREGFRATREYGAKQPGVRRVLMLGDSFTFGVGVDDYLTYPSRVEHRLARWCSEQRVEGINAGVGSYGTSHELIVLERHAALAPFIYTVFKVTRVGWARQGPGAAERA